MEGELASLGFRVVALSPDRPEKMVDRLKVKDLSYALYSDQTMNAARAFGIAFQVDDGTLDRYKGFGIDLAAASGRPHHQLPVPSVFLVAKGGEILWTYSNDDYKIRPENEALLDAAKRFAEDTGAPSAN